MAENGVRFVAGSWNAICDVCAQKYKSSEMRKRWDGLMVCPNDWEPRHPQDFLRSVPDRQAVPWSRPQTPDVFVPSNWDGYAQDFVGFNESLQTTAIYVRFIPSQPVLQTLTPIARALNDQVLNWGALGGADPATPLTGESVSLIESLILGVTTALTDTTTMSETLMALLGTALFDDTTISEELLVTFLFKQQPLNGGALNSGPL